MDRPSRDPLIVDINQLHLRTRAYIKVMRCVDHKCTTFLGKRLEEREREREDEDEGEREG